MDTKVCNKCKIEKPLSDYHNNAGCLFGKATICKVCVSNASKERALKDPTYKSLLAQRALVRYYKDIDASREKAKNRAKDKARKNGVQEMYKLTKDSFVSRSILSHPALSFDYTDSVITGSTGSTEITCQFGHKFSQTVNVHLNGGLCPFCTGVRMNTETFCEKGGLSHGQGEYDYSKVVYTKSNVKVEITCKNGHTFMQTPNQHLSGHGCRLCSDKVAATRMRKTLEQFIAEGKAAQLTTFDYSEAVYTGDDRFVKLTCSKGHTFLQKAGSHIVGIGCPSCSSYGYSVGKPGSLYVMKSDNITKIGITNKDVAIRASKISKSSGRLFDIEAEIKFADGFIPKSIESLLLKEMRDSHKQPDEVFDGSTECFFDVDYKELMKRIVEEASILYQ